MVRHLTFLAAACWVLPALDAFSQTYAEHIVGGLNDPMYATHVAGDPNRLFVVRIWSGEIQIIDLNSRAILPDPYLVVPDLPNPLNSPEQGLLGLTFDPDYATNGYFYTYFTAADNSLNVRRYRVLGDPATSNVADPDSGQSILNIPKNVSAIHNAGWIDFGPNDGYLYVNIGGPRGLDSQDITDNLHGKILRIDVRGDDFPDDPLQNYAIPLTNPFVGKEGDDEIWAFGLRNPFQASFDRLTGDLWINDTGHDTREEVNYQPASSPGGENYGWPLREGSTEGPAGFGGPLLPEYTDPIYDYDHNEPDPLFRGTVIAASGFYRGPVAAFYGHYFFADNGTGNFWKLDPDAVDPRASVTNVNDLLQPDSSSLVRAPTFGRDAVGNMYIMDFETTPNGDVFRVATASRDVVWHGDDATSGTPGTGTNWGDANNWSRDGVVDTGFIDEDHVIFAPGSSQSVVDLGEDRTAAAVTFQASHELQNHTLNVLSGNVFVEDGVTATIDSTLTAESANHSIRKLGLGTLLITGEAGQTAVKEGTLGGSGFIDHLTVRDGGTVAPGDGIGGLNVDNSFTIHPGGALSMEIGGTVAGTEHDQLVVGGIAALGGLLEVELAGEFLPGFGDVFEILGAAGGISGRFDSSSLPDLAGGLSWRLVYDGLDVRLLVGVAGDYDMDGSVNAADYVVWRKTLGSTTDLAADGDGSGSVDEDDYQLWRANFGAAAPAASAKLSTSVPESSAWALLILGTLVLCSPCRAAFSHPVEQAVRISARPRRYAGASAAVSANDLLITGLARRAR